MTRLAAKHGHSEVLQRGPLGEGEVLDAGGGPFEEGALVPRQRSQGGLELGVIERQGSFGSSFAKPLCIPPQRRFTTATHLVDDHRGVAEGRCIDCLAPEFLDLMGFEPAQHHVPVSPVANVREPSRRRTERARRSSSRATCSSREPLAASLTRVK